MPAKNKLKAEEEVDISEVLFPGRRALNEKLGLKGDLFSIPTGEALGLQKSSLSLNSKIKGVGLNLELGGDVQLSLFYAGEFKEKYEKYVGPDSPLAREYKAAKEASGYYADHPYDSFMETSGVQYGVIVDLPPELFFEPVANTANSLWKLLSRPFIKQEPT